ncbi:MAG TPA: hypothetical protein VF980_01705 [Thermoanaerobaculia bacterium]
MRTTILLAIALAAACQQRHEVTTPQPTTTRDALHAPTAPCRWISEAEASELLGEPVVYRQARTPGTCNLGPNGRPASGQSAISVVFTIDEDTGSYRALVERDDASIVAGVGERAVWNTRGGSLVAIKGKRRLLMTIADSKVPSMLTETDLQRKAVALAERIVSKM